MEETKRGARGREEGAGSLQRALVGMSIFVRTNLDFRTWSIFSFQTRLMMIVKMLGGKLHILKSEEVVSEQSEDLQKTGTC